MTKNLVFNKQIGLAVGMIVFVVAAFIGGTGAFFSDTETSTGNVFTAGAVNIAITAITHSPATPNLVEFTTINNGLAFSFNDLKPLDTGTVTYTLNNTDNEAFVCAMVTETGNDDNGINDPEAEALDTTPGIGGGELGQFLNFKFGTQSGSLSAISGMWQTVGTIASPGTLPAAIDYCFGTFSGSNCVLGAGTYNLAQTDRLTADVKFQAVQTRNNSGFSCADLNTTTTVVNSQTAGWGFLQETPTGTGQFVTGPSSPVSGTGSAEFTVDSAGGVVLIGLGSLAGTPLNDIDTLSYSTYRVSGAPALAVALQLNVDADITDANNAWQGRLVYEPYHTKTVNTGVWETWNTQDNDASGNWWFSNGTLAANTTCSQATPCTWNEVKAAIPNGGIHPTQGAVALKAGGGWTGGFVGNADALTIGINGLTTVYNFEN